MRLPYNPSTRDLILEAANRLFYELGYEKASYERIARECGVSKALVAYHFKTKVDLGIEVFASNRFESVDFVEQRIIGRHGEIERAAFPAVFDRIMLRQMRDDRKVWEFFRDISPFNMSSHPYGSYMYEKYLGQDAAQAPSGVPSPLLPIAGRGAATALINEYFASEELQASIPYEEVEEYRVALHYKIQGYGVQETRRLCALGREVADKLGIKFMPNFELR